MALLQTLLQNIRSGLENARSWDEQIPVGEERLSVDELIRRGLGVEAIEARRRAAARAASDPLGQREPGRRAQEYLLQDLEKEIARRYQEEMGVGRGKFTRGSRWAIELLENLFSPEYRARGGKRGRIREEVLDIYKAQAPHIQRAEAEEIRSEAKREIESMRQEAAFDRALLNYAAKMTPEQRQLLEARADQYRAVARRAGAETALKQLEADFLETHGYRPGTAPGEVVATQARLEDPEFAKEHTRYWLTRQAPALFRALEPRQTGVGPQGRRTTTIRLIPDHDPVSGRVTMRAVPITTISRPLEAPESRTAEIPSPLQQSFMEFLGIPRTAETRAPAVPEPPPEKVLGPRLGTDPKDPELQPATKVPDKFEKPKTAIPTPLGKITIKEAPKRYAFAAEDPNPLANIRTPRAAQQEMEALKSLRENRMMTTAVMSLEAPELKRYLGPILGSDWMVKIQRMGNNVNASRAILNQFLSRNYIEELLRATGKQSNEQDRRWTAMASANPTDSLEELISKVFMTRLYTEYKYFTDYKLHPEFRTKLLEREDEVDKKLLNYTKYLTKQFLSGNPPKENRFNMSLIFEPEINRYKRGKL